MATLSYDNKESIFGNLAHFSERRGLYIALSVLLIVAGAAAIWMDVYSTMLTVTLLGAFLVASGIFVLMHSVLSKQWQGFLMSFLLGILYMVTGFGLMSRPWIGAVTLTMMMAAFFIVSGLFRILTAAVIRFDHWGWFIISGLISLALGIFIAMAWPVSSLFMIGLFVGIELLVAGVSLLALTISAHHPSHLKSA